MAKIIAHGLGLAALFFGTWLLLGNVNFLKYFHAEEITRETEHTLGTLILTELQKKGEDREHDSVYTFVNSIKKKICDANNIKDSSIALHILSQDEINAIALPDRQLVVYAGMIRYCKSPEELAGVLAHEIAHIEQGHVMKRLRNQLGLSMMAVLAGGDASADIARETARMLSSTAFDRGMESDADAAAVRMMAQSGIDPEHFADVIFRLSQEKNNIPKSFEWISTHPNSQDRCAEILRLRKLESYRVIPIASNKVWEDIRRRAAENH